MNIPAVLPQPRVGETTLVIAECTFLTFRKPNSKTEGVWLFESEPNQVCFVLALDRFLMETSRLGFWVMNFFYFFFLSERHNIICVPEQCRLLHSVT